MNHIPSWFWIFGLSNFFLPHTGSEQPTISDLTDFSFFDYFLLNTYSLATPYLSNVWSSRMFSCNAMSQKIPIFYWFSLTITFMFHFLIYKEPHTWKIFCFLIYIFLEIMFFFPIKHYSGSTPSPTRPHLTKRINPLSSLPKNFFNLNKLVIILIY